MIEVCNLRLSQRIVLWQERPDVTVSPELPILSQTCALKIQFLFPEHLRSIKCSPSFCAPRTSLASLMRVERVRMFCFILKLRWKVNWAEGAISVYSDLLCLLWFSTFAHRRPTRKTFYFCTFHSIGLRGLFSYAAGYFITAACFLGCTISVEWKYVNITCARSHRSKLPCVLLHLWLYIQSWSWQFPRHMCWMSECEAS